MRASDPGGRRSVVHRRMQPRDVEEPHRAATPLELLFDLTFVVAVGQLAGHLAHAYLDGSLLQAIGPFLMTFFAIWWAWMNFTWFASAYDCDDVAYRLAAFIQMAGVLVVAAGTGDAFEHADFTAVTLGYLVMRVGLLSLWLRAAVQHPGSRPTALRYAGGIAALEVLWLSRLLTEGHWSTGTFVSLALLELTLPVWAERRQPTSWHPHHISERYALFTIILLGEGVFAATSAVITVIDDADRPQLLVVSAAELVVVAAIWWLYFASPAAPGLASRRGWSFVWGYGHYVLFAAMAALSAGLEVVVLTAAGHVDLVTDRAAAAAVVVPAAAVLVLLDELRVPPSGRWSGLEVGTAAALPAFVFIVIGADSVGSTVAVALVALVLVGAVVADDLAPDRQQFPRKEWA